MYIYILNGDRKLKCGVCKILSMTKIFLFLSSSYRLNGTNMLFKLMNLIKNKKNLSIYIYIYIT